MGNLDQVANTFWQLVVLPVHGARWMLATPPGVADNTGLVDTQAATAFVTGFEASQLLQFSPLAVTSDTGTSWAQGVLGHGLAAVPDALAATNSGLVAALTNQASGGVVLDDGPTKWRRVISANGLVASPAGHRCGISALTALAYSPSGQLMVGASCRRDGQVGILGDAAGAWHLVGPSLPKAEETTITSVIRLRAQIGEVSALLSVRSDHHRALLETNLAGDGDWSRPVPLPLAPSDTVISTGFGVNGATVVMLSDNGADVADVLKAGSNSWTQLPETPPHTAAVAFEIGGDIDALVVNGAKLTIYRLNVTTQQWQAFQVLDVPIQYGSSS